MRMCVLPELHAIACGTSPRATLVYVEKQNVTLSLPKSLLQKLRVSAAKRNVSMSSLAESAISKMILDEDDYDERGRRLIERMKNSPSRGTGGKITWTREELHERVP